MKCFYEFVVVKVPSVFIDETRYKGVGGLQILQDVFFQPERHIRTYGIVHSVPDELFSTPLATNHSSAPSYHDYPRYEWKTNADIELEIRPGDKVYFHWNSLLPDENGGSKWNRSFVGSKKEMENDVEVEYHYFRIKYDAIYAAVRYESTTPGSRPFEWWMEDLAKILRVPAKTDDTEEAKTDMVNRLAFTDDLGALHSYERKVIMIGSYVLVEPNFETWEDISIPTPETINGKVLLDPSTGKPKLKPKDQWMVVKSQPKEKYLQGWVVHTGSPLKGDKSFLQPGMYVFLQLHGDTKIEFEGKPYYRLRQRHIMSIDTSKSRANVA